MSPEDSQALSLLNRLVEVPVEQWRNFNVSLSSVSTNANGRVERGTLRNGKRFFKKPGQKTFSWILE